MTRNLYTDKFLMVLLGLIIVAIIACSVLLILGFGKGSATPTTQAPPVSPPSNMT